MEKSEWKLINKFTAIDDHGKKHTLHEFQEFIIIESHSGSEIIPGLKDTEMDDGTKLTPVRTETNVFKNPRNGDIYTIIEAD